MARGGRRAGNKGTAYSNRSDLHQPMPPAAPTGLPYGARGQMIASQRAVPMRPAPSPQPAPAPQGAPLPGAMPLLRPTERPNEPVTHGLPVGPGAGPEAIQGVGASGFGHSSTADMLSQLAQVPGASQDVANLANYAQQARG